MPDLILDFDKDFARKKIFEELSKYSEEERERIIADAGFGDRYKYDIKEDNTNFPSLPAVVALSRIFKQRDPSKTIDYFLYEDYDFFKLKEGEFMNIPFIEPKTDDKGNIIYSKNISHCALRYNFITNIAENPSKLVLFKVNSDCMENTLTKADEIIIDISQKQIKDGDIFAFNTFNFKFIMLRRFLVQVNTLKLIADNKEKYEAFMADLKDINIIGQVIISKHILF